MDTNELYMLKQVLRIQDDQKEQFIKIFGKKIFDHQRQESLNNFIHEVGLEIFGITDLRQQLDFSEVQLKAALHFCPKEAINFDNSRADQRRDVIYAYLINNHKFPENNDTVVIASSISKIVGNWEQDREKTNLYLSPLLDKQEGKCAHCHAKIKRGNNNLTQPRKDIYKPYYKNRTLQNPEIDHVKAISLDGTNAIENLRVLCKMCNRGKSDKAISVKHELSICSKEIEEVTVANISRLFYHRVALSDSKCDVCEKSNQELTIRKIHEDGLFILSNLRVICYKCEDKKTSR